ncbi:hypothetical protein ABPG77_001464 [Micractinium sp. CCAP 211/92]
MCATPLPACVGACTRANRQSVGNDRSCDRPGRHPRRPVVGCAAQQKQEAAALLAAGAGQEGMPGCLGRRSTLLAALQTAAAVLAQPALATVQASNPDLVVGAGGDCATIGEALSRAPSGGIVEVRGGRYAERLVLTRPVTLRAAADEAAEVVWETQQPYQATIEAGPELAEGAVVLQGLRIRHSSPSIANNYAVRLAGCSVTLADCDISSATGVGVGIEGGAPRLLRCSVHNCQRHGVAVFGDLLGAGCAAQLEDCTLVGNRLNGLLVRDGAQPSVRRCTLSGNGEWGLRLQDAGGAYEGNAIAANSRGSVGCSMLYDEVDTARMVVENKLDRPVHFLGPKD